MAIQVIWTPAMEEEFIKRAGLDGVDAEIIRIRHHRYGRIKDLEILKDRGYYISSDLYDKHIRFLKHLYDCVQPGSILPPRQDTREKALQISAEYLQKNTI